MPESNDLINREVWDRRMSAYGVSGLKASLALLAATAAAEAVCEVLRPKEEQKSDAEGASNARGHR